MFRFTLLLLILISVSSLQAQTGRTGIFINGQELSPQWVGGLESYYKVKIQKGRYWYDNRCGLWGMEGGQALGIVMPNLQLGNLKSNASNGRTGIFINGRQINQAERLQWHQLLGNTIPGRYTLDQYGNLSTVYGQYICNVVQLGRAKKGNSFYRNSYLGTGSGGNSDGFYVMGKDWSVSVF